MDFDPRDYDSRDEDRAPTRDRGGRGASDRDDERDDEWSRPAGFSRDRDDDGRDLGRGPGDSRGSHSAERGRDARDDARRSERNRITCGIARSIARSMSPAADIAGRSPRAKCWTD